jgi:tripartite-type tricarboxylate transporter receptor subunit TctC
MRRRAFLRVASLPAIAWPYASRAQAFPTKPITIVVPYTAGGPLDTTGRILAEHMQATLGQTVVIDNVAGAGGAIGVTRAARANPDGYTISAGNQGSHITLGSVQTVSFDLLRDFAPVVMFATTTQLILARKTMDATNLREFLAWLRANPGKATDGGGGYGTVAHTPPRFISSS